MVTHQDALIPILVPNFLDVVVMAITSLRMTNSTLSKLISKVSHIDHKRTWQEVPNALLFYLYNRYIVCAHDKYAYHNIDVLQYIYKSTTLFPQGKYVL